MVILLIANTPVQMWPLFHFRWYALSLRQLPRMFKLPQTPIFCPYDVGYYIFSVRLYELNSRELPLPSNAAPSSDDSDECSEVACSYA